MWHSAVNRSLGGPAGTHKQSCINCSSFPSVNSSQAHFADLLLQLYYRDSHVLEQIRQQTKVLQYPQHLKGWIKYTNQQTWGKSQLSELIYKTNQIKQLTNCSTIPPLMCQYTSDPCKSKSVCITANQACRKGIVSTPDAVLWSQMPKQQLCFVSSQNHELYTSSMLLSYMIKVYTYYTVPVKSLHTPSNS